jgi:hypothetical protein
MNKQTEHFLNALKDIEEGKVVPLDKVLNEEPPSEELQKIFNDIDQMDSEREAWKRMFDLQTRLVTNLELDKIKLEKEINGLKKEVQIYKDVIRLSDHLCKVRTKETKHSLPAEWVEENL